MANLSYNDTLGAYAEYSKAIQPYLVRTETNPAIQRILSKSHMRILIDLVSRARIRNPDREINVKLGRVADNLSVTRRTVTRAITTFFELGWLRYDPNYDGRNRRGRYAAQQYILTDTLRALVGLPTKAVQEAQKTACTLESAPEGSTTADTQFDALEGTQNELEHNDAKGADRGTQENPNVEFDETQMSHGLIGVNNCFLKKEASFNKEAQKTGGIPHDLRELQRELRMEHRGVCALMKIAKQVGQRLQDVWKAKGHLLRSSQIKEGRAFNYIKALLLSGDDFAYIARTRHIGSKPKQTSASTGSKPVKQSSDTSDPLSPANLAKIALTCKFKKFRHVSKDMVIRVYDGTADVLWGAVRSFYCEEQMEGVYRGIALGNLTEDCD